MGAGRDSPDPGFPGRADLGRPTLVPGPEVLPSFSMFLVLPALFGFYLFVFRTTSTGGSRPGTPAATTQTRVDTVRTCIL